MTVLFGHPSGNPNSYHAALAHFEADWLEGFCVPWMLSRETIRRLDGLGWLPKVSQRLARRHFYQLHDAPKIEGRFGEFFRLAMRGLGLGNEAFPYQANDWLMRTMAEECGRRTSVTAVHSYEDCSLWQFQIAKKQNKACIYDMPIGYYPAWEETQASLASKYSDWLPAGELPTHRFVRPKQKREEMQLADLVLAPSSFVEQTVRRFFPKKKVALAQYGVDLEFWSPSSTKVNSGGPMRFIYAGQISLRKGIPDLLVAWERAELRDAELELVGSWQLSLQKRNALPSNVKWTAPCGPEQLRARYRAADVFIFPSHFEGFGLVLLEAMACGLPAVATPATAGPDILSSGSGSIIPAGDINSITDQLRHCFENRDRTAEMGRAARLQAQLFSWASYRTSVREAVRPYI